MRANYRLDRSVVAIDVDGTIHVLVDLVAPPAPGVTRKPIDVAVVIDRSGSMSGRKLEAVRRAVIQLGRLLGPADRLAVVTFDGNAQLVLPLGSHATAEFERTIAGIRAGGSTNLSGGWLCAHDELSNRGRDEALRRIIVLTDGEANAGIHDPALLVGIVGGGRQKEITTSVIGFGTGFNEELCGSMADAGGGRDYFCEGPDQAPAVFRTEFEGLAALVAQNIVVELRPDSRVRDVELVSDLPFTTVDGALRIDVGDAIADEKRSVIAKLRVGGISEPAAVKVADLEIRWTSIVGDVATHSTTIPVMVGAAPGADADAAPVDEEVVERVDVLLAARARQEAMRLAYRGHFDEARRRIADAREIARRHPAMANDLREILADEQAIEDGRVSSRETKSSYAAMKEKMRGEGTRRRFLTEDPDADPYA